MTVFIDPDARVERERDGITFIFRPLTATEFAAVQDAVAPMVSIGQAPDGEAPQRGKTFLTGRWALESLRRGLVGWKGEGAPPFEQGPHGGASDASLSRLSWSTQLWGAQQIESLNTVGPEEKSDSQS